jgi:hypothetical protein
MLRATGTREGRRWVLFGLQDENLRRLRDGKPIRVNLQQLNPGALPNPELPDIDVMIAYDDGHLSALMEGHNPQ